MDDYIELGDFDFSDLDFDSLRNTYGSLAPSTLNTPPTRTPNAAVGVETVGASPSNTTVGIGTTSAARTNTTVGVGATRTHSSSTSQQSLYTTRSRLHGHETHDRT